MAAGHFVPVSKGYFPGSPQEARITGFTLTEEVVSGEKYFLFCPGTQFNRLPVSTYTSRGEWFVALSPERILIFTHSY
jgi:hypothetical protein